MKKFLVKNATAISVVLVVAMLCCFPVCRYIVREKLIDDYNAVIGKLYEEDRTLAEKAAEYFYSSDLTKEHQEQGYLAMKEFGYTKQGMSLAKTYDLRVYRSTGIALAVLFVLLLYMLRLQKQQNQTELSWEKERLKEELWHSNRGEQTLLKTKQNTLQTYVENVAHQVRTPLTNAMLNIALVYDKQSESDQKMLDECSYHMERVNKLMERLLKIGRLEAGKVELAKEKDDVAKLLANLARLYPEQVKTELSKVELYFDYEWLYEALSCLIENCLDHVGAECVVQIRLSATENLAIITLEDNGDGFKEEDIPYLFERFYSSEKLKATGHYGIGLNLAKLVVEQHFGKISAYNRPEGGAGFKIELPKYKLK